MRMPICFLAGLALLASTSPTRSQQQPPLTAVDVTIETGAGTVTARLELAKAPISSCNFLRYALAGDYDGGRFFRTVHGVDAVPIDVIQAEARQGEEFSRFAPIPLERTSLTGLTHEAGALSMARWGPDTATSSFSILAKASPGMDYGGLRNPDRQGFAVFGKVIGGMDVVSTIHRRPAVEEKLQAPVEIRRVALADGSQDNRAKTTQACASYWSGPAG